MKRGILLFVSLLFLLGLSATAADVPHLLNFQGRLDDDTGQIVPDSVYALMFSFYDAPEFGTLLWQENRSVTTTDGLFTILLGAVTEIPDATFDVDSCYLEIEMIGSGPIAPRARLTSVAYARRAGTAMQIDGVNIPDLEESAEITSSISTHTANPGSHHQKTLSADEIVTGTITEARLPQKAIDDTEIEDGTLTAAQLSDEPGIAHTYTSLVPLSSTVKIIDSALIYAPSFVYVVVIANGYYYDQHLPGGETSATMSLSTSRTTHDNTYRARFEVRTDAPAGHTTENFTIQRVATVSQGMVKFYLLASHVGTEFPNVQNIHINTLFFPTSYGEIDATAAQE